MKRCHACGTGWDGINQPAPRETCGKCDRDLHVCLNCSLYDETKSGRCMVETGERVLYADRANFCEEFRFSEREPDGGKPDDTEAARAREQWKKLFGG